MKSQGVDAKFYDAWDIGFVSDSNYMAAELLDERKVVRKDVKKVVRKDEWKVVKKVKI